MTDNVAILQGFTDEYMACSGDVELHILVRPGTDLDSLFEAWDCDMEKMVKLSGWLFEYEVIA